jgi:hypothetical protein
MHPTSAEQSLIDFTCSDLQRDAAKLQTKLGHSSSLHNQQSVSALKAAVLELERLIDRLSEFRGPGTVVELQEQIKEDWKLGWDGIVKEPTRARTAQRPTLTLDKDLLCPSRNTGAIVSGGVDTPQ